MANLPGILTSVGPVSPMQIGKVLADIHRVDMNCPCSAMVYNERIKKREEKKSRISIGLFLSILFGIIHRVSQQGIYDLFYMPMAEIRKEDGHFVKGIQVRRLR